MDIPRALFELFRLGARFGDVRHRLAHATRTGLRIAALLSVTLTVGAIGLCVLVYALDRTLARWLGEPGSAFLLAILLLGGAGLIASRACSALRPAPPPPPVADQPGEMSGSALLALLGGIIVGTVLQARRDNKDQA